MYTWGHCDEVIYFLQSAGMCYGLGILRTWKQSSNAMFVSTCVCTTTNGPRKLAVKFFFNFISLFEGQKLFFGSLWFSCQKRNLKFMDRIARYIFWLQPDSCRCRFVGNIARTYRFFLIILRSCYDCMSTRNV